ncbi:hypothetical protein CLV30_13412 [Haloactinopolyspora alba]|uniref:Secreted protein n=1 Tax=Haloactinopolyspora alba TaxID=648780 RepID=A0A2P8D3B9_9ACTN|nr:DUF5719 family protein [Haloactinopolyspora alba]PSK91711.1 hypothetical protein CLV30_13412 [Haloactinopolyspora alba]
MIRTGWIGLGTGAALAIVLGGATLVGPPESVVSEHPSVSKPVVRSSVVCPYVDGEDQGAGVAGVLALPGVDTPQAADGEQPPITAERLAPAPAPGSDQPPASADENAEPEFTVNRRGVPVIREVETGEATSLAVTGSGKLAPGLAGEQSLLVQETDLRGISTAACTEPRREHWFVGGSGQVGRRGRVILANPTDVPAVVDIELWDEAGPLDAPGTQDVAVPARGQRVFLLDALAPGSKATAVHVTTNRGQVAAALEMRESDEITPMGMSFVPVASGPSERILVPGVPGHGQRTLQILAPGDTDAIVSMQILGPDGAFSPLDQDVLTVPAGTVMNVPLEAVGGDPSGVRLESDQPITAGVRMVESPSDDGLPEIAYTAATPPLDGPAPALLSRASSGFTSRLMISSVVERPTRVRVRTLNADGGEVSAQKVNIAPGATVPVELTAPEGSPRATVIVEPELPGSVIAAREIAGTDDDGALSDLMPLVAPTVDVEVPVVVGELPEVPEPTSRSD